VLAIVVTVQLVIALDFSIVNIALPDIGRANILTTSASHGLITTAEGKAACDTFD
jgi:hypothetical protein